ncbi:histidine kinase dimerization/phospho-acceptor domain-containing protein, partial [Pantoea sp. SIMBA_072]
LSQLNQALSEAKSQAEAVSKSKTRFLAAVSHDLMQPLNAARLFSAALSQQAEGMNDEAQQLVQHMDSSLRSAEELISDLLDISRLENGKITPDAK